MADRTNLEVAEIFSQLADALETGKFGDKPRIGLTLLESEHGPAELVRGAELAREKYPDLEIVLIGTDVDTDFELINCDCLADAHQIMNQMLDQGQLDGAVTLHYSFPLGVSTVGRVLTPGRGKEMLLATTTGTSATDRVISMVKNSIYGLATAKALGWEDPSLGILNVEGARLVEKKLRQLIDNGYKINFSESARSDGGIVMRGNDLLQGTPDIMVADSLTGNLLMKMFSAYSTGGGYEALGYGYGPGVGEGFNRVISIISRASGAPVIADALKYTAQVCNGGINQQLEFELNQAKKAGLLEILKDTEEAKGEIKDKVEMPERKTVNEEIPGIDILEIDQAKEKVWKADIYAETGMGCTGPVILVAAEDAESAKEILLEEGFLD